MRGGKAGERHESHELTRIMDPKRIEYDIGTTVHGQPLTLTHTQGTGGEKMWVLRQDAANQRDEGAVISGLSDNNIVAMFEAVSNKQGRARQSGYNGPG